MNRIKTVLALWLIAAAAIFCPVPAVAGSVVLAWDTYQDLADGFYLYAAKKPDVEPVPANRIATVSGTSATTAYIAGIKAGHTYFVATAYVYDEDLGILESGKSNEVSAIVRPHTVINVRIEER